MSSFSLFPISMSAFMSSSDSFLPSTEQPRTTIIALLFLALALDTICLVFLSLILVTEHEFIT